VNTHAPPQLKPNCACILGRGSDMSVCGYTRRAWNMFLPTAFLLLLGFVGVHGGEGGRIGDARGTFSSAGLVGRRVCVCVGLTSLACNVLLLTNGVAIRDLRDPGVMMQYCGSCCAVLCCAVLTCPSSERCPHCERRISPWWKSTALITR
jgi:hypothetical protein